MHTREGILDLHARAHRCLRGLIVHCEGFAPAEVDRPFEGFGYATIRLQIAHVIGAEHYWVGVLQGMIDAEDKDHLYPTMGSLEGWRAEVAASTGAYLRGTTTEALNEPRTVTTWNGRTPTLAPAHVILRTITHVFHHQGQVAAMARLLGRPVAGLDFPLD